MKTGHAFQHGIKNILTLTANTAMPKPEVIRHHHKHNLRNRFHVIKTLGQGTYGKVKLAVEKSSGDKVAIKSIRKDKIQNEQDLTRIRREIEIMSTLSHPHIITVYEVFENRDKIILVMEYAAGGELYDYINDRRGLSDDDARKFFRQIVSAVHYLHQNGIVHRDLKLENIVLDGESNVRIADFGLSNIYGQEQLLNTFCGSPLYASPEIVNGQPYSGPEVDCWSLGVLLYTLVYGAMPFDGTDFRKLRQQITEGNYFDPPNQSDAAGLIRKLLHVDKDKRATIMEIGHHWWINVGFEYTPLEDYYQGRPVDFHYLQKSLSITLSSDSDSELHGKGTPRVPPPPKGILKKRREEEGDVFCDRQRSLSEGGYLTNDAHLPQRTSYHRESRYHSDGEPRSSTNGDHMQTSESPVLAPPPQFDTEPDRRRRHHKNHNVRDPRNRHSWHAERPLPNVQPAFDSNKKPKRGILKNKHTCVPVVCDSGCVMDHPTDSHLGSMPGYSGLVCSERKRWPGTLQTQSSCGSVSDIVSEGSSNKLYDLDDIESVLDDIVPANSVPSDSISGNHISGPEENECSFKSRLVQRSGHDDTMDLPWDHSLSVCSESVGSQSTSGDNAKQVPLTSTPIQAAQSVKKRKGILKKNGKYSSSSDTDPTWRYSLGSQGSNSSGDILNFSFDSTDGDHFMAAFYPRRPSQGESSRPYCQDFVCQNNQWDGQKVGHSDLGHFPLSFKNLGDDMLNKINTFTGEEREKHHGQENVGLFDRLEAKEVYKRAIEICNKFA